MVQQERAHLTSAPAGHVDQARIDSWARQARQAEGIHLLCLGNPSNDYYHYQYIHFSYSEIMLRLNDRGELIAALIGRVSLE
jgi:hypothetical protein